MVKLSVRGNWSCLTSEVREPVWPQRPQSLPPTCAWLTARESEGGSLPFSGDQQTLFPKCHAVGGKRKKNTLIPLGSLKEAQT